VTAKLTTQAISFGSAPYFVANSCSESRWRWVGGVFAKIFDAGCPVKGIPRRCSHGWGSASDTSVNAQRIEGVECSGATIAVAGAAIYGAKDPKAAAKGLREKIKHVG
jgi:hypothetical protein